MLQGDAIQKLHGDERLLAVLADFVDGANVWMVESGGGTRLAAEAFESLRVARHLLRQELEGDEAAQFGVFSFVDHTHASAAKFLDDTGVGDGLVDHIDAPRRRAASRGFILRTRRRSVNKDSYPGYWGRKISLGPQSCT